MAEHFSNLQKDITKYSRSLMSSECDKFEETRTKTHCHQTFTRRRHTENLEVAKEKRLITGRGSS